MFFTSGEDRVFPRGLAAGKVTSVHDGGNFQDITVEPSGTGTAPEEVLVILDPVHQAIPEEAAPDTPVFLAPDVNPNDQSPQSGALLTTADKLRDQYKKIGDAQKHVFGQGLPGTPPPNFNLKVPGVNAPAETHPRGTNSGSIPLRDRKHQQHQLRRHQLRQHQAPRRRRQSRNPDGIPGQRPDHGG